MQESALYPRPHRNRFWLMERTSTLEKLLQPFLCLGLLFAFGCIYAFQKATTDK